MYERLSNKKATPTAEEFTTHLGEACDIFTLFNDYIKDGWANETALYFDAHDQGWSIKYYYKYLSKKTYLCNIVAEKDAFLFVTNLKEEDAEKLHKSGTPHAKICVENSPYRHRGWIEYRVISIENIEEAKSILQMKINGIQLKIK